MHTGSIVLGGKLYSMYAAVYIKLIDSRYRRLYEPIKYL